MEYAYDQGYYAFLAGKELSENPYDGDDQDLREAWRNGWHCAKNS